MDAGGGIIMVLSYILIFLGIFAFAKEAPKFIREMLGMKGEGGKLFGGLSAAMGIGAAAAGTVGSFNASRKASLAADEARKVGNPTSLLNRGKHLLAGFAGAAGGFTTGVKASWGAKDHNARTAFDAMQKRNNQIIAAGEAGSTALGRVQSRASKLFTGDSKGAKKSRDIAGMESRLKAYDEVKKRVSSEMVKQTWTTGDVTVEDKNGQKHQVKANYKSFMAAKNAAETAGKSVFTFKDAIDPTKEYKVQLNFCPKCKNRLKVGAKECPSCGINIEEYLYNN